jgi:acyl-CoA synthetase (NDP forming)
VTRPHSRLAGLLAPRSVALVGLPGDPQVPLARPLHALRRHGYPGRIYPVNPRHAAIDGVPCFPSLGALPERPDVAWVAVPEGRVLDVLEQCVALGIPHAVVAAAGFAESGPDGAARQAALAARVREGPLTVLGPNSIGFVNPWERVPLSFSAAVDAPVLLPGEIGIVSQSGGLGGAVLSRLQDRRLGTSVFISTGNEVDVTLDECLGFLVDDSRTGVVVLVVEGIRDGDRFRRAAARALESGKPVIVLRLGTTDAGARLARSHTGAVVGSRQAWQAVADQLGLVVVEDVPEVVDAVVWCTRARPTPLRRVAVVTSSGGAAVQLADALTTAGFELPPLADPAVERLRRILPAYATTANPLDVTAGLPDATFAAALEAVGDAGDVDALLLPITMLAPEQAVARLQAIERVARAIPSAVAVCWLGGRLPAPAVDAADRAAVAAFVSSTAMVRAMAAVRRHRLARGRWARRAPPAPLPAVDVEETGLLSYAASCRLLQAAGIPLPRQALAADAAAARAGARAIGFPVVAKVLGPGFAHKADRGAVRIGLGTDAAVAEALAALAALSAGEAREGFLVQEQRCGVEVLVGVTRDPTFGLLLTVGPGGTATELAGDHRAVPLPATAEEIAALIAAIPSLRVLGAHRGRPPGDVAALVDVAVRVGRLAETLGPRLRELDLNPVVVGPQGAGAVPVDVLVVLEDEP